MLEKPSALIATFCITGAVLVGCGGSASVNPARTATRHAQQTPLMSNPDIGVAQQQSSEPAAAPGQLPPGRSHSSVRADESRLPTAKIAKARKPETSGNESTTGAKPMNPCKLVRLAEAHAITRGAITNATEAPLGPTCIYSGTGPAAGVKLAVQSESFSQVTRHMSARKHMLISGHRSVCGRLGTQMLLVPLARNELLNVTAPCKVAQRFAAVAVSRLSA